MSRNDEDYKKTFYDAMYGRTAPAEGQARRTFLDRLHAMFRRYELHREDAVAALVEPCGRLLDLGCGEGSFLFKIAEKARELHGADISSVRIAGAVATKRASHPRSDITFRAADIDRALPYDDGYFDAVTCIATFEHLYDPYSVIREIRRILKQDGSVIIEVPNIAWLPRRIAFLFGGLPRTSNEAGWDGGHLHYFTVGRLREFLDEQGFRTERVTGAGVFAGIRSLWVSMLSGDIIIKARKR